MHHLIPDDYDYFIAGGYAACPALASDIDVWVFDPRGVRSASDIRDNCQRRLLAGVEGMDVELFDDMRDDGSPYYGGTAKTQILRIATITDPEAGTTIHLLATSGGIHDTLDTFDLSVHQIALTANGAVVKGRDWTLVNQPILVLRNTPTTPARIAKLTARYGVTAVNLVEQE